MNILTAQNSTDSNGIPYSPFFFHIRKIWSLKTLRSFHQKHGNTIGIMHYTI